MNVYIDDVNKQPNKTYRFLIYFKSKKVNNYLSVISSHVCLSKCVYLRIVSIIKKVYLKNIIFLSYN